MLTAIKLLFSNSKMNYLLIGLVIYCSVITLLYQFEKSNHKRTVHYFKAFKAELATQTKIQEAKNKALADEGKRNVARIESQHIADINTVASKYVKGFTNDIKNKQTVIANLRNELADKLREQSAISDSAIPKNEQDRPASENSNATITGQAESQNTVEFYKKSYLGARVYIDTLESAGAICAADYNYCKSYVDSEQARLGVEP